MRRAKTGTWTNFEPIVRSTSIMYYNLCKGILNNFGFATVLSHILVYLNFSLVQGLLNTTVLNRLKLIFFCVSYFYFKAVIFCNVIYYFISILT